MENVKKYLIKEEWFVLAFLAVLTFVKVIFAATLNLVPDEAYYWVCSQNTALSYFDHPPIIMQVIRLGTGVLGTTELGVRAGSLVISLLVTLIGYLTVMEFTTKKVAGFTVVVLLNIIPIFFVGSILATPDLPLMLFWSLGIYFLVKLVKTSDEKYWYLLAVFIGFGLLSKYMIVLILATLGVVVVFFKPYRKLLGLKQLVLFTGIVVLIASPVIIWNATHNWASFGFQLKHGLQTYESKPLENLILFFGGQLFIASPVLWTLFLGTVLWYFYKAVKYRNPLLIILSLPFITGIVFFAYTSTRARVEPNWPVTSYFMACILLALWYTENKGKWYVKTIVLTGVVFSVFQTCIIFYPRFSGVYSKKIENEVYRHVYGWQEWATTIAVLAERASPSNSSDMYIFTPQYQLASELRFYLTKTGSVYKNKIICRNLNSRVSGFDYFQKEPVFKTGDNALGLETSEGVIGSYFAESVNLEPVEVRYHNTMIRKTHTLLLKQFKGGIFP
ncbi:MAG: glycosyltransferase family 39 protein [Elusimicrobiota bacterium]